MNILFFLSPKQDLMYVYDDFTLRQTLEKWENNRYASIPVLNRRGEYVGTLTEGDILWGLKKYHGLDLEAAEDVPISAFPHKRDYKAVTVTTSMDQLIEAAMTRTLCPWWMTGASSLASCAGRPSSATATKSPARRKRRSPAVWCRNTPPPTERRKTTGPAMLHLPIFGRVEHFLCKNPRKNLESPIYGMPHVR